VRKGRAARATDQALQDGGLHLHEPAVVEEPADKAHDGGSLAEDLPHLGVHHQVDVSLAVAQLDVLQSVPLLGQRAGGFGQDVERLGQDGQLAGLGDEGRSAHADEVAAFDPAEKVVADLAHHVLLDVGLQLATAVAQLDEGGLAEAAVGDDAAADREPVLGQRRGLGAALAVVVAAGGGGGGGRQLGGEAGQHVRGQVGRLPAVGVRVLSGGAQLGHLPFALGDQLSFVGHGVMTRSSTFRPQASGL
jgi:hypothetical protein